jgi:hypothetical protein
MDSSKLSGEAAAAGITFRETMSGGFANVSYRSTRRSTRSGERAVTADQGSIRATRNPFAK